MEKRILRLNGKILSDRPNLFIQERFWSSSLVIIRNNYFPDIGNWAYPDPYRDAILFANVATLQFMRFV